MSTYPEHEKLQAVKEKSQQVGEFLDWLQETKDYRVCEIHRHTESCYGEDGKAWGALCDMSDKQWYPVAVRIEKTLSEFFGIDLKKLEIEKQEMLAEFRK